MVMLKYGLFLLSKPQIPLLSQNEANFPKTFELKCLFICYRKLLKTRCLFFTLIWSVQINIFLYPV